MGSICRDDRGQPLTDAHCEAAQDAASGMYARAIAFHAPGRAPRRAGTRGCRNAGGANGLFVRTGRSIRGGHRNTRKNPGVITLASSAQPSFLPLSDRARCRYRQL